MKNVIVAAFAAMVTAVLVVACGGTKDVCKDKNIQCESPLSCDPADGVCKCGGAGGIECKQGEVCEADSNTCLSTRCAGVNCSAGTTCDVQDGTCKCGGTGGTVCDQGYICNPATKSCVVATDCNQVACAVNQTCDATDSQCKCGGAICGTGETCAVNTDKTKSCVKDNCSGVSCLGGTSCDPADGRCKCNGDVCAAGLVCGCEASADGGTCDNSARSCVVPVDSCQDVTCPSGTTCDPTDQQCKCGGPGGPICAADQICSLTTFQCQGGQQCTQSNGKPKVCSDDATSCDPEDGLCKCGGRGGEVCSDGTDGTAAEICADMHFSNTCKQHCDPRLQDCPNGEYCFFDVTLRHPNSYCAAATNTKIEGQGCNAATDCFTTNPAPKGLFCNGLGSFDQSGSTGFCRSYCDTTVGDQSCAQVPVPQHCTAITGNGWSAPAGVGFCEPIP